MRFSANAVINAPPEKVFALVDDLEEWHRWIPSIKKIEKITEGTLKEGSQIRVTATSGITIKLLMTNTEFVPGQRGVMQGNVFGTRMTRFYTFERIDEGTRLTAGGDVSGPLAFLIRRGGQRLSEEIVQAAKKKIESSGD